MPNDMLEVLLRDINPTEINAFVRAIQTAKEHVAGLTATPRPGAHPG